MRILLICDWERKIPKFQETKVKGYSWVSFNKKTIEALVAVCIFAATFIIRREYYMPARGYEFSCF